MQGQETSPESQTKQAIVRDGIYLCDRSGLPLWVIPLVILAIVAFSRPPIS
jgi:hypothetical protein